MRLLPRLSLLVVLGAGPSVGTSHAESVDAWLPLAVGSQKSYAAHWDATYEPSNGPSERIFSRGRIDERVAAKVTAKESEADWPGPVFRATERIFRRRLDGSEEHWERNDRYFSVGNRGGSMRLGAGGPPIRILSPAPERGERWPAGRLAIDEMSVELEGEVVGYEDLEVSGEPVPRCLHVRLSGAPGGWTQTPGGRARLTGGRFELNLWFAEAIGIVKSVTRGDFELALQEGDAAVEARSTVVSNSRLLDYSMSTPEP